MDGREVYRDGGGVRETCRDGRQREETWDPKTDGDRLITMERKPVGKARNRYIEMKEGN